MRVKGTACARYIENLPPWMKILLTVPSTAWVLPLSESWQPFLQSTSALPLAFSARSISLAPFGMIFTVFAPTNEAFAALPAGTVEGLLKPEAKDTLTKILTCHVVGAKAMSDAVMKMVKDDGGAHKVKTVGGCELNLKLDGDKVTVTDEAGGVANVTIADVEQSNGVIHVIDKVLLPKM